MGEGGSAKAAGDGAADDSAGEGAAADAVGDGAADDPAREGGSGDAAGEGAARDAAGQGAANVVAEEGSGGSGSEEAGSEETGSEETGSEETAGEAAGGGGAGDGAAAEDPVGRDGDGVPPDVTRVTDDSPLWVSGGWGLPPLSASGRLADVGNDPADVGVGSPASADNASRSIATPCPASRPDPCSRLVSPWWPGRSRATAVCGRPSRIRPTSPLSTVPGPTSTKVRTPVPSIPPTTVTRAPCRRRPGAGAPAVTSRRDARTGSRPRRAWSRRFRPGRHGVQRVRVPTSTTRPGARSWANRRRRVPDLPDGAPARDLVGRRSEGDLGGAGAVGADRVEVAPALVVVQVDVDDLLPVG